MRLCFGFSSVAPQRLSSKRCGRAAQILRISEKGEISVETQGFRRGGFWNGGNLFSGGVRLVSQKIMAIFPSNPEKSFAESQVSSVQI